MNIQFQNISNYFTFRPDTKKLGLNKMSYPNLAPLANDTVSFSGRSELIASSMEDAPSVKLCKEVEQNAEPARYYLEKVLDKYISPIVERDKKNPSLKLQYKTRIKSNVSIREKVVSKFAKLFDKEQSEFASQLTNEIQRYFHLNPEYDSKLLRQAVLDIIKPDKGSAKVSPYQNTRVNVNNAFESLDRFNVINYDGISNTQKQKNIDKIIEHITPKEDTPLVVNSKSVDPTTLTGIKHYAQDIVGARIVMQESGPSNTGKVLQALKQAVNDGALKIVSIENYIPDSSRLPKGKKLSDYIYATEKQLRNLADNCEALLVTSKSKTGYMAIHINIDLSDDLFKQYGGMYNGYKGEIQIIGRDIEQLKDIEDLCYKIKDKKNAFKSAYKSFKTLFLAHYNTDEKKEAFDQYTYAAYLAQRSISTRKGKETLPTIQEMGFQGKVDEELDFNRLKLEKQYCDAVYREQQKQLNNSSTEKHISTQARNAQIIQQGNIDTMKKLIDSNF